MEYLTSMCFDQSAKKVAHLFRGVRRLANGLDIDIVLLDEVECVATTYHLLTTV